MAERNTEIPLVILDVAIGAAAAGLGGLGRGRDAASRLASPVTSLARRTVRWAGGSEAAGIARRLRDTGYAARTAAGEAVRDRLLSAVPRLLDALLDQVDLTDLVERRVDLDDLVRRVDVGAVAARLDLDGIVARVDLDAVVARVDLDAVVSRVDLDAVVARVDLDAVVSRVDLDAVVARLDLIGLAEQVVDGIDLPRIVRESSASVTSEGVSGVRMQSMEADQAITHFVDRILRRSRPAAQAEPRLDGSGAGAGTGALDAGRSTDGR
jgi:hypothetical protein